MHHPVRRFNTLMLTKSPDGFENLYNRLNR